METQLLEAQIIYSVLFNEDLLSEIDILSEEDFFVYRNLFKNIKNLKKEDKVIDYALVKAIDPKIDEVIDLVLSENNLGIVLYPDKKVFEERVGELKEIILKKKIKEADVNQLDFEILKENIERLSKKGQSRWLTDQDILTLAYKLMQEKKENDLIYYIKVLDKATGGIKKGTYIIVAGRPSVGKSALLQFIGLKNAEKNKKVLFVSVEMSEEMVVKRILQTYKPETIPSGFNILIANDTKTIDEEIKKRGRDFDLILVDYIQLLRPKAFSKDLYERVTNISAELKTMATKFNLPFICASQYSRRAEGRQPSLADLRESGALEQDADVVISLYKKPTDDELNINPELTTLRIDLLKNRNGWTFSNTDTKNYSLMFDKKNFIFYEIENTLDK